MQSRLSAADAIHRVREGRCQLSSLADRHSTQHPTAVAEDDVEASRIIETAQPEELADALDRRLGASAAEQSLGDCLAAGRRERWGVYPITITHLNAGCERFSDWHGGTPAAP